MERGGVVKPLIRGEAINLAGGKRRASAASEDIRFSVDKFSSYEHAEGPAAASRRRSRAKIGVGKPPLIFRRGSAWLGFGFGLGALLSFGAGEHTCRRDYRYARPRREKWVVRHILVLSGF